MFLKRGRGTIVEGFGQLAAALREKHAGGIEFIGWLRPRGQGFLECALFGKLCRAGLATREVRGNLLALALAYFVAHEEHEKRTDVPAAHDLLKGAHRRPPSSLRSLRVARNSEFFTVSSVVPSASPIARSFKPW